MRFCQACRVTYTEKEMRILNLKMHIFPRRDWQRNFLLSWLSFCGMPLQTTDLKNKFVCSMHFSADDYFPGGNRRLRLDAVPHLCPPSELVVGGDPTKNIATKPIQKKNLYDLGRREMVENVKRQLCRLCGKREGQLRPIFENSIKEEERDIDSSVATKIKMYLPVKIDKEEPLPLNICSRCLDLLDKFHEMSITCIAVDNIIRRSFGVDETDALFEDAKERAEREALESDKYKQHLRRTVLRVVEEHQILFEAITKPMGTTGQPYSTFEGSEPTSGFIQKQFICSYCGEGFRFFKLRTKHMIVCRELPGVCEVCGKEFPRKDLKKHAKQAHSLPKNYMCDKCAKCFRSMQTLDYHTKTRHEPKPDIKYYCELCCKTFGSKPSYDAHIKNHENGNINLIFSIDTNGMDEDSIVFKCSVCEETFDDKLSLIVHLNYPKEVKCAMCLNRFHNEKRYLVHQAADKWKCQHCDKVFCYKHHVVAHERVHTGEKPFKCMVCDMRFRALSHKIKHQTIHHPPQYQCLYCSKQFRYKGTYEDHVNLHIGNEVTCHLCDKKFGGKFSLYRHTRRYHKTSKPTEPQPLEIEGFQGDIVDQSDLIFQDDNCEVVDIITLDLETLCENMMQGSDD